ncbi:glycoside hydrolase family 28 protein [Novosphingobium sp. YAF33]|uniref:glycoside hydrolase family 28 protein n=1 Tax=Novosphingobium sp. YAF33 TaxID=3233082 RepID=UPI003F9B6A7A
MSSSHCDRRTFALSVMALPLLAQAGGAGAEPDIAVSIVSFGAKADGVTINTRAIQAAIDSLAKRGGGTVVVPKGVFVSGALFLKPRVHLHLAEGAVLRCTTRMENFPPRRTRIEGHFEPSFTPALINADGCHGLRITGSGTLDGAGRPVWDRFWKLRNAAPVPDEFPNLGLPRARLALIENSKNVLVEGVTFKDSQFWNLHLYRCEDVLVRYARFEVPDDYAQAPSTDGIDVDSCRQVTVDGCTFSVTDDCIAAKGSKGPHALEDRDSPPVEGLRVRNCHFRRGHHALACGSEATVVRDVVMENCRVTGRMVLARLKLRADTPQRYEDIRFRNIRLDHAEGTVMAVEPWSQYTDLKGMAPPMSWVRGLEFSGISGRFGALGTIRPNPGQTEIRDVLLKNFALQLADGELHGQGVEDIVFDHVMINGKVRKAPAAQG